ncbi:MAG: YwiC-like family protein [Acidobacteriota bacterium]
MPLLIPREHGAYGQLAYPVLTTFIVAGVTSPALLLAVAVAAAFVGHEALLVLLGRRGTRVARERRAEAVSWLMGTGLVAAGTAGGALWLCAPDLRWSLAVPAVPVAVLIWTIARGTEKSAIGETAVALACSLAALPVGLMAGASAAGAWTVALAFAATFVAATLAVRASILDVRGGGDARAARRTRLASAVVAGLFALGLAAGGVQGALPWIALAAAAPGLGAAVWLTLRPPPPTRLRVTGWTLVGVSTAAAVMLIAGLR